MRVNPKATITSKAYTLVPKLLRYEPTFYVKEFKEDYAIKQDYVLARHKKKPFTATLKKVT